MKRQTLSFSFGSILFGVLIAQVATLSSALAHDELPLEEPEKLVMKISETGFQPPILKLTKLDSSVFLVNITRDSLVTLEVNFNGKQAHCANSNMTFTSAGVMKSKSPIPPKDFAAICFPEKGVYEATVYGVGQKPIYGKIISE